MWSKSDQVILWLVTYSPLILIMLIRFATSNKYLDLDMLLIFLGEQSIFRSTLAQEIYFVFFILLITLLLYRWSIKWFLSKYEENLKPGGDGETLSIRKLNKLSVNDYSFFLLTLLLPLISLDHSSAFNLALSFIILSFIITIYVKTNAISVCPLFYFSGRTVFKGTISRGSKLAERTDPTLRQNVVIIMKDSNLDLNQKYRGIELVDDVYYLTLLNKE